MTKVEFRNLKERFTKYEPFVTFSNNFQFLLIWLKLLEEQP